MNKLLGMNLLQMKGLYIKQGLLIIYRMFTLKKLKTQTPISFINVKKS